MQFEQNPEMLELVYASGHSEKVFYQLANVASCVKSIGGFLYLPHSLG